MLDLTRAPGVHHDVLHPDKCYPARQWSQDETLHVAACFNNPCLWDTRRKHFNDFRRHMAASRNVVLHVAELSYDQRPFEVTSDCNPLDYQFRSRHQIWHKENLLNLAVQRFPNGWKYGAVIDGDCMFTRPDWALETIQQLQFYDWVQMYSSYTDMSPDHRPLRTSPSFAYRYSKGEIGSGDQRAGKDARGYGVGTTGLAWAFRQTAFAAVGGLMDRCPLGSGDWHMAFGLIGEPDTHPQTSELLRCGQNYADYIKTWQNRAAAAIKHNVGYVRGHAVHYFHGSKSNRGYGTRWMILRDHDFNPYVDLFPDDNGLYQLTPDKPRLRDEIRRYFASRNEDDISLGAGDKPLV
jgi:hypothetical protein